MILHDGVVSTTTDVWAVLTAAKNGDLEQIKKLGENSPGLLYCQYDYTTPMQLAVREGHAEIVRYLIENGALDSEDRNHPFLESLVTLAGDRGYNGIAENLRKGLDDPELVHTRGDAGKIDHDYGDEQVRFQKAVDESQHTEVEGMLRANCALAENDLAFWGEGVLSVPAKAADRNMIELLMNYGASVPDLSKWGARYYFKHFEIAEFLLENGMNPDHMNWREFTLLHDMGFTGEVEKARLLVEHDAHIDAVDEEYHSTPLGYAAHFGHLEVVKLLLEHGADPNKGGAKWARPLASAERKGHREIVTELTRAGSS